MTVRSISGLLTLSLLVCAGGAQAAVISGENVCSEASSVLDGCGPGPINYTITFTGGGAGISSIGPGSFTYDSMGQTGTVSPPVTLTNYMVPVTFDEDVIPDWASSQFIYTQTSPEDDNVVLDKNGFATAVSVDSQGNDSFQDMLVLNDDNTWELLAPSTPVSIKQPAVASGTYSINAPAGVPEPASLGLIAAGLIGLSFVRRFASRH